MIISFFLHLKFRENSTGVVPVSLCPGVWILRTLQRKPDRGILKCPHFFWRAKRWRGPTTLDSPSLCSLRGVEGGSRDPPPGFKAASQLDPPRNFGASREMVPLYDAQECAAFPFSSWGVGWWWLLHPIRRVSFGGPFLATCPPPLRVKPPSLRPAQRGVGREDAGEGAKGNCCSSPGSGVCPCVPGGAGAKDPGDRSRSLPTPCCRLRGAGLSRANFYPPLPVRLGERARARYRSGREFWEL